MIPRGSHKTVLSLTAEYTNNHQIPMIKPSGQFQFHQIRPQVITVNGISTCTHLNNWFQTSQPVTLLVSFTQLKGPSIHSLPEKDPELIKSIVQTLDNSKFELNNLWQGGEPNLKENSRNPNMLCKALVPTSCHKQHFFAGSPHTSPGYYFLWDQDAWSCLSQTNTSWSLGIVFQDLSVIL